MSKFKLNRGMDMGFLKNLKSKTCNAIGVCLEKVGEITHFFSLEMLGLDMQINNPVSKKVDVTNSNASVQDTIDVHRACEKARQEAAEQAAPIEEEYIDRIEEDIENYKNALLGVLPTEVMQGFDYSIGNDFTKELHNTVSNYVSKKISQDNDEFVKILNMEDSVRLIKSEQYIKKVLSEASTELYEKCQNKKISLYRKMYDDLDKYFSNQRKLGEEQERNYQELMAHKNDIAYQEEKAIAKIVDIAHMECIRTLTYANS